MKTLFTIIWSKSFGCGLGVHRATEHSDEIMYAWSKVRDDLFDTRPKTEHRTARDIKEGTFWLTSRHYRPPAELTLYADFSTYVNIDQNKSRFWRKTSENGTNLDSQFSGSIFCPEYSSAYTARSTNTDMPSLATASEFDIATAELYNPLDLRNLRPLKQMSTTDVQRQEREDSQATGVTYDMVC